jgi:hypothetical protein
MRDTIDMAETISHGWWLDDEKLKAFEALVRADEREAFAKIQFESLLQAIRIEREACAKVCEAVAMGEYDTPEFWREGVAYTCAAAIRNRGNT